MNSTRREDIRDFVEAWLKGQMFLAEAYAKVVANKIGRVEEAPKS